MNLRLRKVHPILFFVSTKIKKFLVSPEPPLSTALLTYYVNYFDCHKSKGTLCPNLGSQSFLDEMHFLIKKNRD
jgi:hypothetical protein